MTHKSASSLVFAPSPTKTSPLSNSVIIQGHSNSNSSSSSDATPFSSSSDEPLMFENSSGEERQTLSAKQRQIMAEQNVGQSCIFWNRRSMIGALLISIFLLSGTFALFDSLLDDDDNGRAKNNGGDGELGNEVSLLSDDDAKGYLSRYGYVGTPSQDVSEPRVYAQQHHRTSSDLMGDLTLDSIRSAVRKFQEFAGLPTTGELDNRTRKKMAQPRCGIQDVQMLTSGNYVMKWRKRRLTYQLLHSTDDLSEHMQKQALQMAFDAWSRAVPLDFTESNGYETPDIKVQFARRSHGDPWPFDGRGGVLAHATFPQDGKLHFDDDENWAFMDGRKIANHRFTDLYWVALHEIGHVLGLSHSNIETAIMAPFYQDPSDLVDWRGNYVKPELTSDDLRAAQQIYGKRTSTTGIDGGNSDDRHRRPSSHHRSGGKTNADDGTYDDREGGFWSRLGKMFSDDDNNARTEDEDRRHTHQRQHQTGSRYQNRRDQNHRADESDFDYNSSANFCFISLSLLHFFTLLLTFVAFFHAAF